MKFHEIAECAENFNFNFIIINDKSNHALTSRASHSYFAALINADRFSSLIGLFASIKMREANFILKN